MLVQIKKSKQVFPKKSLPFNPKQALLHNLARAFRAINRAYKVCPKEEARLLKDLLRLRSRVDMLMLRVDLMEAINE